MRSNTEEIQQLLDYLGNANYGDKKLDILIDKAQEEANYIEWNWL